MTPEDEALVRVFVDALSDRFAGVGTTVTDPDVVRAMVATEVPLPPIELPLVIDDRVGSVPVRRYQPGTSPAAQVVVFAHGGGFVIGDLESHDRLCRRLARDLDVDVVATDYRRAPEHPFPAALDDVLEVLQWAAGAWPGVGVAGDSAGGGLVTAALLAASDVDVDAALLVYPVLDATMATGSYEENGHGWFLTADLMAWFWRCYLGSAADPTAPVVSPASAADEQLTRFPPTVVITAERDPLRDEGDVFAARLARLGVDVDHLPVAGLFHGFFGLSDVLPPAAGPVADAIAAFGRRLAAARTSRERATG